MALAPLAASKVPQGSVSCPRVLPPTPTREWYSKTIQLSAGSPFKCQTQQMGQMSFKSFHLKGFTLAWEPTFAQFLSVAKEILEIGRLSSFFCSAVQGDSSDENVKGHKMLGRKAKCLHPTPAAKTSRFWTSRIWGHSSCSLIPAAQHYWAKINYE